METRQNDQPVSGQRAASGSAPTEDRPRTAQRQSPPARKRPAQGGKRPAQTARQKQEPSRHRQEAQRQKQPSQAHARRSSAAPAPARKRPREEPKQGLPDSVSTKRRAYGKSKPKKRSALASVADSIRQANRRRVEKAEQAPKVRKRKKRPSQPTPAVIYTQPQAFNRNRLFVQLLTVTAVVVALVMGLAVFFKVETITVSGAEVYTAWAVREASGISEGDSLLTFNRTSAGAQIKANLPYVKEVRFGIKLPDTVNIIIEEDDVVYAIQDGNGQWWLMSSDGRVVEQTNGSSAVNYTQVLGVTLESPAANTQALATESLLTQTNAEGETVPATVTGAARLNTALSILQALEENGMVGSAASVDVTSTEEILLWYGTRYQVNLGDSSRLDYKIACMNDVILQLSDYESGVLDLSFTIWSDRAIYTPFG